MNRNALWTSICLAVCLVAAGARAEDREGSKDHPLITRYPGSTIDAYDQKEFDEYNMHVGKCIQNPNDAGDWKCKDQRLEGKFTFIHYELPKGRSTLEVFRNYQQALQKAGFQEVYKCVDQQECGSEPGGTDYKMHYYGSWKNRYLAARLPRREGDVWLALNVVEPEVNMVVVEVKPMEGGLITVDAAALANDIARTGHSAVYGIYFDTGKADVKPESDAGLGEIAKLLKQDAALKLHVVGHTDNVGDLKSNMDLSRRRAEAVVKVLTGKHGIAPDRLDAYGVGPLSPVAANADDDGRARNRRVELVGR
jgi:outer membrane protein OmpA-like peptidoglycan-associated protein